MPRRVKACLAGLSVVLSGIDLEAQSAAGFIARDSGGVRIAENRSPLWAAGRGWRFAATPIVQIGAVDGDTTQLLNQTQYAARLSDGRIVIAQSHHLKVFNPSGKLVTTIGKQGRGPGEFAYGISGLVALPGDTLAVRQATGVMLFDSNGRFVRMISTRIAGLIRDHMSEGGYVLGDGSTLLMLHEREPASWSEGLIRPRVGFVRIAEGMSRADTAGFFPGFEQVVVTGGARPQIEIHPVGRNTYVTTAGDRVFIGDNGRYEIRGFTIAPSRAPGSQPGPMQLTHIIRRTTPPVPYTAGERDAYIARRRSSIESGPADRRDARRVAFERFLAAVEWPRNRPAWGGIQADREGNLWVHETRPAGADPLFSVYDREGRLLGEVARPAGVGVLEIGADYMLGIWRNEDDVEFLRVYPLIKR